LADNFTNSNAILSKLSEKGRIEPADGGRTIVEELEYAENSTFQFYSGYETLNISPSDVFTAAEYDWKQAAVNVTWSGLETRIQNSGKEAIIRLLDKRISNAMKTFANQMSISLYSDGTGYSGKEVDGLLAQVAKDPTSGTVGGINRANWSFWRNNTSGDVASIDSSAALLDTEMRDMWLECTRGTDHPDLILADQGLYEVFWSGLQDIQRVTSGDTAVKGFTSLQFRGVPVVYDGDTITAAGQSNVMWFLNTDYLSYRPHSSTNIVPLPEKNPVNQDAGVVPVVWAGNLCCSNASLQGIIYT
jgi:hypothetical protein